MVFMNIAFKLLLTKYRNSNTSNIILLSINFVFYFVIYFHIPNEAKDAIYFNHTFLDCSHTQGYVTKYCSNKIIQMLYLIDISRNIIILNSQISKYYFLKFNLKK